MPGIYRPDTSIAGIHRRLIHDDIAYTAGLRLDAQDQRLVIANFAGKTLAFLVDNNGARAGSIMKPIAPPTLSTPEAMVR